MVYRGRAVLVFCYPTPSPTNRVEERGVRGRGAILFRNVYSLPFSFLSSSSCRVARRRRGSRQEHMRQYLTEGARQTWPKLQMVSNHAGPSPVVAHRAPVG